MRKNYLDHLRWMCIMLLFPYHVGMIWSSFDSFYVWAGSNIPISCFIRFIHPWYMSLMFVIAGMSSYYALQKRNYKEFVIERVKRLLIPFLAGIALPIPVIVCISAITHNVYQGSLGTQYLYYFTHITNLSGYEGAFSPAHLWFVMFLFVISMIGIPLFRAIEKRFTRLRQMKIGIIGIALMSLAVWPMLYVLYDRDISFGKYFMLFALGYMMLSRDDILDLIERYRYILLGVTIAMSSIYTYLFVVREMRGILVEGLMIAVGWLGVLTLIGIGKNSLNFRNCITDYISRASFFIYIFHLTWIIVIAYIVLKNISGIPLQFVLITLSSFVCTILNYELFKRVPVLRALFGIKSK